MTRFLAAAAIGALIVSTSISFAATGTASGAMPHRTAQHYSEKCNSLAGQWKTTLDGHGMSPHLGKAKADAAKGEKLCSSSKASLQKRGAAEYRAALKLLGVQPS